MTGASGAPCSALVVAALALTNIDEAVTGARPGVLALPLPG